MPEEIGDLIDLELKFTLDVGYRLFDTLDDTAIKKHENGYTVKLTLPENNWLYDFLMSFGNKVTIIQPKSIRQTLLSSLDKGKQKTNNIIGCQPYTKHRFQQNRSGVFVCVLDIVTRSAPARFHRSVHGVSAGFIPRRRATHSTAGAACQSRRCAAVLRTLDWLSRLCYLPRRDGGYILQSRPLSLDRERAGG